MKDGKSIGTEKELMDKDVIQPSWHCDIYCRKIRHVNCEGKAYVKEDASNECPYLEEMLY